MQVRISDLMDDIQDDTVFVKGNIVVSPERIRERTMQRLRAHGVSTRRRAKPGVMLAAAILISALVMGSAFAVWKFLSPADVAMHVGDPSLAQAFDSDDAVVINQSVQTGDLTVTLLGIVSGDDIADNWVKHNGDYVDDRSHIVVSVAYTDGRAVTQEPDDEVYGNVMIAAMFEGYAPWELNSLLFSGGAYYFIEDGVLYQLMSCDNLEIFADKTVYLGVYTDAIAPGFEIFTMDENGEILVKKEYDKPCALFELPLDSSRADPAAAAKLLGSIAR